MRTLPRACAALAVAAALSAQPLGAFAEGAPVVGAGASSPAAPAPPPATSTDLFVAVSVNGTKVDDSALVLRDPSGVWYVTVDQAVRWRLDKTVAGQPRLRDGVAYVRLDAFGTVSFDEPTQTLSLQAPAASFVRTTLGNAVEAPTLSGGGGGFLNYDLVQNVGSGTRALGAFFDAGYGNDGAVADQTYAYAAGRPVRLESAWRHDLPGQRASVVVGDNVSHAGTLGGSVRFAGLQYASNFATDPNFITQPTLALGASAALPSTVDVYVNGGSTLRTDVPAGPFTLQDLAVPAGAGALQVQITDALGRTRVVNVPFYGTPTLLRRGLSDVAYEVGFLRLDYGTESAHYGPPFVEATLRRGMDDRFTAELHAEGGDDAALATFDGTWLLGNGGVLTAGVASSASTFGGGDLGSLGYDYSAGPIGIGGQLQLAHDARRIGQAGGVETPERTLNAHLSFGLGRATRVGASYVSVQRNGVPQTVVAANFSTAMRAAHLNASYVRSGGRGSSFVTLQMPLGQTSGLSLTRSDEGSSRSDGVELYGSSQSSAQRLSYDVRARDGAGAAVAGSAQLSEPIADFDVTLQDDASGARAQTEMRGALTFTRAGVVPIQQVVDGFGLVEVPGYPGVSVLVGGTPAGRTDRHGLLVVRGLTPYRNNAVSLDAADLPVAANLAATSASVAPYFRSPGVLRFASAPAGGVLLTILRDGKPIDAGATVALHGGTATWPVADGGRAFISGLPSGPAFFTVTDDLGKTCDFNVVVPPNAADMPDLGEVACVSKGA